VRLFGCNHERLTWPLSMVNGERQECYQACLECGKEFPFDLRFFKVTNAEKVQAVTASKPKAAQADRSESPAL